MTLVERQKWLIVGGLHLECRDAGIAALDTLIRMAVAAEREACAKVAEATRFDISVSMGSGDVYRHRDGGYVCPKIAAAIRARGEPQRPASLLGKPVEWVDSLQNDQVQFYAGMGQAPMTKAVSSAGRLVEVDYCRAGRQNDEQAGHAEVRFRVGGGQWQTKNGPITQDNPRLNLVDDVDADFSRLFDAATNPADLRDSTPKPDLGPTEKARQMGMTDQVVGQVLEQVEMVLEAILNDPQTKGARLWRGPMIPRVLARVKALLGRAATPAWPMSSADIEALGAELGIPPLASILNLQQPPAMKPDDVDRGPLDDNGRPWDSRYPMNYTQEYRPRADDVDYPTDHFGDLGGRG